MSHTTVTRTAPRHTHTHTHTAHGGSREQSAKNRQGHDHGLQTTHVAVSPLRVLVSHWLARLSATPRSRRNNLRYWWNTSSPSRVSASRVSAPLCHIVRRRAQRRSACRRGANGRCALPSPPPNQRVYCLSLRDDADDVLVSVTTTLLRRCPAAYVVRSSGGRQEIYIARIGEWRRDRWLM